MNPMTILIGAAACIFGVYTAFIRTTNPGKLGKLEAMRKQWGERAGTAVHVIAYTVVPIIFGIVMIISGIRGGALF